MIVKKIKYLMLKISFWLKKPDTARGSLEYITIGSPQKAKIENDTWESRYACEIYLSEFKEMKNNHPPIYGPNPFDALSLAVEIVKIHLQGLVNRGYTINEAENDNWGLKKMDPQVYFLEKMRALKNNKEIPQEAKDKILATMKEIFGKLPHMKDLFDKI